MNSTTPHQYTLEELLKLAEQERSTGEKVYPRCPAPEDIITVLGYDKPGDWGHPRKAIITPKP